MPKKFETCPIVDEAEIIQEICRKQKRVIDTASSVVHISANSEEESVFRVTPDLIKMAYETFRPRKEAVNPNNPFEVQQLKQRLDKLHSKFKSRLQTHIYIRARDKEFSWVWTKFVQQNLKPCLLPILLAGHLKDDLRPSSAACWLQSPSTDAFQEATKSEGAGLITLDEVGASLEGGYLHWDLVNQVWVRSGKTITATGDKTTRHCKRRNLEHTDAASKDHLSSLFYASHPSKDSKARNNPRARGYWEDLVRYCSLGFDRSQVTRTHKLTSVDNGLFIWCDEVMTRLENIDFKGSTCIKDKQLHMVGYLIELMYDLALGNNNNLSEAPGFEVPLGAWISS